MIVASLFFYGYWNLAILLLLIATVALNYRAALYMEQWSEIPSRRRRALTVAVAGNLLFLAVFKYYNFFALNTDRIFALFGATDPLPILNIILPVGISFYTFQITGYIIDVYRYQIGAERSFGNLLLFTTYFPQLVSGPIERAGKLLPLLRNPIGPLQGEIASGANLALWGIFKKVFIADNLSQFVDIVLLPGNDTPFPATSLAAIFFALQVYADFSGYTDVARGISRMMGIELTLNFNLPFLSTNPAEFWRRWHITLSAFLRDYLYIPLGGSRLGRLRQVINVMVVWTLGGLWHGASLGFLVWGIYCGMLIVLYLLTAPLWRRLGALHPSLNGSLRFLGRIYTFLTFAHGLLLFRVESVEHLHLLVNNLFPDATIFSFPFSIVGALIFYSWPLLLMQIFQARRGRLEILNELSPVWRIIILSTGGLLFLLLGVFQGDQFFYFQF